jgi:hypothetical protein
MRFGSGSKWTFLENSRRKIEDRSKGIGFHTKQYFFFSNLVEEAGPRIRGGNVRMTVQGVQFFVVL